MKRRESVLPPRAPLLPLGPRQPATQELHLAADAHAAALTRLELGVMRAQEAFASWAVELNKHVAGETLSYQDVALLHSVRLRGGSPSLTDMLIFLHRHDLAALQYSFRKLERLGLVRRLRGAMRREISYDVTDKGREITEAYARLRHEVLVKLLGGIVDMDRSMHDAASVLERMVGIYDQATQTILNEHLLAQSNPHTRSDGKRRESRKSKANGGTAQPHLPD